MANKIHGYHSHVYFTEDTRSSADHLRKELIDNFGPLVRIHGLIDEPIGPHPLPMFEVDLRPEDFEVVVPWMMLHHGDHSILIHPITGDDLADHRDHSIWIGQQLPLNLLILS